MYCKCGSVSYEALDSGCMARGSDYRLKCYGCGKVIVAGKHPGRREYFPGTDEEYRRGTILEIEGLGITDTVRGGQ